MSTTTSGFPEDQSQRRGQSPVGVEYIPTEEERRVFRECNQESFWYRSVPFSVVSMALTQALVVRGTLSASPRFGALPKVAFAGFCGYLAGKMSYMKTCQEKFKRLENSPLGEALRQRTGLPQQYPTRTAQSEMSDPDTQSFEPVFQPPEASSLGGYSMESPTQMGRADDYNAPAESYVEEEEPRKKGILYEDLRLKNRENYEVTLTQKAESMLKTSQDKELRRPTKEEHLWRHLGRVSHVKCESIQSLRSQSLQISWNLSDVLPFLVFTVVSFSNCNFFAKESRKTNLNK